MRPIRLYQLWGLPTALAGDGGVHGVGGRHNYKSSEVESVTLAAFIVL